jgi:hypothetical protein
VVISPPDHPVELAVPDLDRVEQRVEAVVEGAVNIRYGHGHGSIGEKA